MSELLDTSEPLKALRRGEIVEGVVVRVDHDGILVSIGQKSEGVVPPGEMRSLAQETLDHLKVGDEILTMVVRADTESGPAILSMDRAREEKGWRLLEGCLESGETVEGQVIGFNRGGAIVEIEGIQGFVPLSQLVTAGRDNRGEAPEATQDTGTSDIGKTLRLKILELNRRRNRAVLSERVAIQEWREGQKERLVQELTEGQIRRGNVTSICSFGAFVDLGGADGLIHISELSWDPVQTPDEVLKVGQEIDVYVLRVDTETRKIALSLRRLLPEPWETVSDRYQVGQLVAGTVTKVADFGAFARIEGSVEGLIHISELSDRLIRHPKEVVKEGDVLTLKILRIEPERRRLGLSLKQAEEEL